MAKNIEIQINTGTNSYEVLYPKTLGSLIDGKVASATSADNATQLTTARTIRTNLASTSTASFNGTANITPGVTGTLGTSNGGTGVTSYSSLASQLSSYLQGQTIIHKLQVITTAHFSAITIPSYSGYTIKWFLVQGYYSSSISEMGVLNSLYDFIPVAPNESSRTSDAYAWGYWSKTGTGTSTSFRLDYSAINNCPYFQSSSNRIFGLDQVIHIDSALPYNFYLFYVKN